MFRYKNKAGRGPMVEINSTIGPAASALCYGVDSGWLSVITTLHQALVERVVVGFAYNCEVVDIRDESLNLQVSNGNRGKGLSQFNEIFSQHNIMLVETLNALHHFNKLVINTIHRQPFGQVIAFYVLPYLKVKHSFSNAHITNHTVEVLNKIILFNINFVNSRRRYV